MRKAVKDSDILKIRSKWSVDRSSRPLLVFQRFSSTTISSIITSPLPVQAAVFMFTVPDAAITAICLEGFFFGKISYLFVLTGTLASTKEVHLFPGLRLYSGTFAM